LDAPEDLVLGAAWRAAAEVRERRLAPAAVFFF
jgi:hypothetical protein